MLVRTTDSYQNIEDRACRSVREKNPSKTLVSMKELKLGITVPLCSAAKSQDIEKEAATVTVSAVVVRLWLGRRDDTKKVCLSHCYMYSPDEDMCNGACLCFGSAGECAPLLPHGGGMGESQFRQLQKS